MFYGRRVSLISSKDFRVETTLALRRASIDVGLYIGRHRHAWLGRQPVDRPPPMDRRFWQFSPLRLGNCASKGFLGWPGGEFHGRSSDVQLGGSFAGVVTYDANTGVMFGVLISAGSVIFAGFM